MNVHCWWIHAPHTLCAGISFLKPSLKISRRRFKTDIYAATMFVLSLYFTKTIQIWGFMWGVVDVCSNRGLKCVSAVWKFICGHWGFASGRELTWTDTKFDASRLKIVLSWRYLQLACKTSLKHIKFWNCSVLRMTFSTADSDTLLSRRMIWVILPIIESSHEKCCACFLTCLY